MNANIIDIRSKQSAALPLQAARYRRAALGPATVGGPFSATEDGALAFDATPGLVIRVHEGSLWVPHPEDECSVCLCAGEEFVVTCSGRLTTLARRGTQISLDWPAREHAATAVEETLAWDGTVLRAAAS